MNDFYIKGVTILGKTPVHTNSVALSLSFIWFVIAIILVVVGSIYLFYKKDKNIGVSDLFGALLFVILTGVCLSGAKVNNVYLVSIDETASYIELNEKFSDITKLENGLYEVELNVCD